MKQNRVAHVASIVFLVLAIGLTPAALAGRGGGKGGNCKRNAPGVSIDNNWGWSQWGSWGKPGQPLAYAIQVRNYDMACGSSSFVISMSTPNGFSVSIPTSAINLRSYTSGYLSAYVTSPSAIADGDYPVIVTVARAGTSSETSSFTSYYKVYSSDSTAPNLFWPNPAPGQTISGNSFDFAVSSSDDHAVQKIELYMDGDAFMSATACDDISYTCQLNYQWRVGAPGQHTATFKATDWMGNVGVLTVNFTVS
jgi:Bacterial Ig domain